MDFWLNHPKIPHILEIVEKSSPNTSIISICGEIKSGKRMLGDWLQDHSFSEPIFWIRPKVIYGNDAMFDSLVESISSKDSKANENCQEFKRAWNELKNSESHDEKNNFNDWVKTLGATVFSQLYTKNPSKLFFFLDDYSKWSINSKNWFSNFIKKFLAQTNLHYQVNFILTGEKSLHNTLELKDYWEPWRNYLEEIDWHSFTKKDLENIFKLANIPKDLVKDLYQETKGLPGPVFKKLDLLMDSLMQKNVDEGIKNKMGTLSGLPKKTILLLAHNRSLDSESIYCLLNEENSQDLIKSIDFDNPFSFKQRKFPLLLKTKDRAEILTYHEVEKPVEFLEYKRKVDAYQRFQKKIPDRDRRDALRLLCLFENFHKDLLVEVFGDRSMKLWFLVKNDPSLFIPVSNGYKVTDALREDIKNSGFGIKSGKLSSIKKKAHSYWLNYKKKIEKDHSSLLIIIENLKKQEIKNQHNFEKICKKTNHYQKRFVKNFKGNHRRLNNNFITVEFVKNSFVFPFILAMIGFLFLYLSLIYKDFTLVYLIAGITSLCAGFVISSKSGVRKIKKRKKKNQEEIDNSLKNDPFNKVLGLHKDALNHKKTELTKKLRNLDKNRQDLKNIIENSFIR